ncbi:hypothetical protein [Longispora albida]|uniref:hypothetical protein n=1 Tax=Longispora albida TaxID=203523 RepID=UPI00035ECFB9|nr:hypothetical protein [Longispora albida]
MNHTSPGAEWRPGDQLVLQHGNGLGRADTSEVATVRRACPLTGQLHVELATGASSVLLPGLIDQVHRVTPAWTYDDTGLVLR